MGSPLRRPVVSGPRKQIVYRRTQGPRQAPLQPRRSPLARYHSREVANRHAEAAGEAGQGEPLLVNEGLAVSAQSRHSGGQICGKGNFGHQSVSRKKFGHHTTLPDRLRAARDAAGLKKVDLAKKTGLSLPYVGQLESGKYKPSKAALVSWSMATGVNPTWLETGQGEMRGAMGIAEEDRASYIKEPRSWQAALEPCLAGSPLEGALSRPQLLGGLEEDLIWRELPETKREETRQQLRRFAFTAVAADALGEPFRTKVLDALTIQLINYITSQLSKSD